MLVLSESNVRATIGASEAIDMVARAGGECAAGTSDAPLRTKLSVPELTRLVRLQYLMCCRRGRRGRRRAPVPARLGVRDCRQDRHPVGHLLARDIPRGAGFLVSGVSGVASMNVMIIGEGVVGTSAAFIAIRMEESHRGRDEGRLRMRVLIISDMEGVCGITKREQVRGGESLYEEGRKLYTEEINAAVRGARGAGATEIVAMDRHGAGKGWTFNSLVPDLLDPNVEFVVQHEWTEYTEFLEQGCDAALFVGMHAMAGTADGVLSHTVSSTRWHNLYFNGTRVGETGINAAFCGTWGCPALMVTGDVATCSEARALLGDGLTTVAVKRGLGRFSARHVAVARARQMIEDGARAALSNPSAVAPYDPGKPCEIEIEFASPDHAEKYRYREGVELRDARTVATVADDWLTAWHRFFL